MSQSPHPRPLWRVSSHPRWCPVRSVSGGTPVGQINPRPRDDFLEAMGSGWWVAAHLFAVFGFILVALGVMAIWDLVRDTREISVSALSGPPVLCSLLQPVLARHCVVRKTHGVTEYPADGGTSVPDSVRSSAVSHISSWVTMTVASSVPAATPAFTSRS
jgi:hypothetical protein